jgi:hypothetical protein
MTARNIRYGSNSLVIRKFDIKSMPNFVTIAMIAKRASGKSYLTKELLFHMRDIPTAIAISKTEKLNKFYTEFIPDLYIYDDYSSSILDKIYQRQEQIEMDNQKRKKEGKKEKDGRLILIMDDCMSSKGAWVKEPQIAELFFNGRHYKMSFILTMQFSLGIPPEMRSNFDFIFLLAEDFINNRKRLYEHYAGMFPDFNTFSQVFLDLTENYGCMVINNRIHSKDITEKVFWYRAKETPNFTIGSRNYKKYHDKKYDNNWNKKIEVFDPTMFLSRKKKASNLVVEKVH